MFRELGRRIGEGFLGSKRQNPSPEFSKHLLLIYKKEIPLLPGLEGKTSRYSYGGVDADGIEIGTFEVNWGKATTKTVILKRNPDGAFEVEDQGISPKKPKT